MKSVTLLLVLALTVFLSLGVCQSADAVDPGAITGELLVYFSEHDGTTDSVTLDLGGVLTPTGTLTSTLDLTNPLNSYEVFDFKTGTVREEVDTILDCDLFQTLGIDPIRMHATETGTFFVVDSFFDIDTGLFSYEITTELRGTVVVPPGSPFEGWIWTNKKTQTVSVSGSVGPDGTVTATVSKSWETKDAEIEDPIGGTIYITQGRGSGLLSTTPVPEPSTLLLLLSSALVVVVGLLRRRARTR